MKTQATFSANFYASIGSETDDALKMTENFLKKGYTAEQAKLKVVWENPHIASICAAMPNMTILQANIDEALNKQRLSGGTGSGWNNMLEKRLPATAADELHICESAVDLDVPISDILRCSMYAHGYGSRDMALSLFNTLTDTRDNVFKADYSRAEKSCPQKIKISRVLKRACEDLG